MTEKELLDLLGDVRPDYIVQTEAFRRGGVSPRRKRHTGRRVLSIAAMLAAYALTGHFTNAVLLGALIGFVLAMGNFLSLSITVSNAMNRAANGGSPQKAQLEIQTSSVVRPLVLAVIYIVLFRAKVCDPIAALLPLLFAQVAIKVLEFFRNDKKGGDTAP